VEQAAERIRFDFLPGLPIVVETKPTLMSSDAGVIPLRQFDDRSDSASVSWPACTTRVIRP